MDWRTRFDVSVHMEYSGRVACSSGVLFENSIVCLVVFVCCCFCRISFSRLGVWFFWMPVFGVFVRSDCSELPFWFLFGEFDSGSGRTLAACLTHASRTESALRSDSSGERVSNTWVICPALWDKPGKLGLIPDRTTACMGCGGKLLRCGMGPRPISLLVG